MAMSMHRKLEDPADVLSQMAFDDPSTNGNPKKLNIDHIKNMYEHSISGKLF